MTSTLARPDEPVPPAPGRSRRRRLLIRVAVAAAVVGLGAGVAALAVARLQPHLYTGTVLQAPTPAPEMDGLRLASGQALDLAAFDGDLVVVYFGYTNCPDICPTTLSTVAQARQALPAADRDRTQLIMISVDPERDDLASLQEYVAFFDPSFVGAGGDIADIERVAAQYGVYYEPGPGTADTGYTIDHTATLLGIDPDGRLRVVWAPDVSADALRADIDELLG